ncbi:hypothetical protein E2562_029130 [Oryza meyeriana var. granulata]|uniref:E3 ubiquitin protein ligase DRIP2 n=1 Tax=Oryza meyeriana var. granulata TaxID=110450 RepID=A0A6G1EBS5_9ORYZ|nr:hypothetical protein E2562_029130 [Oryza meyeriana var. granulata]
MVKRELLARCMTCPLCDRLLRDATTVSEIRFLPRRPRLIRVARFPDVGFAVAMAPAAHPRVGVAPAPVRTPRLDVWAAGISLHTSANTEASNHSSNKDTEGDRKELSDKTDELWRPLNCLVEAANRTKSFRSNSQSPIIKREQMSDSPGSTSVNKTKSREHLQNSKIEDDKKDVPLLKRKNQRTGRRTELHVPSDKKPVAAAMQNEKKFSSIWFSLVASFEQEGDPPLPQIPSHYLRIKDGNIPASSIQKYLMQKLGLPNEAEVEINCCGQPVSPTQPLCNLVELWLSGRSTQMTQTMIGSPAKEFVMVLTYGRPKAIAP